MEQETATVEQSAEDSVQGEYFVEDVPDPISPENEEQPESAPEETEDSASVETATESESTEETPEEEQQAEVNYEQEYQNVQSQLAQERKDKNRAFHQLRQLKQQPKEKEETLSDDQLMAIMEEHSGDPKTMFNVMKYAAERAAKAEGSKAVDAVKLSQTKTELDKFTTQNYGFLYDEQSPVYNQANQYKDELGIADHPHADFLIGNTLIAMNHKAELQKAYETGKKEGTVKKTEETRKKNVKESKLESTKKQSSTKGPVIKPEFSDVQNRLGLSESAMKIYADLRAEGGDDD
ncbi:hypothetical protein [Pseudoalteromonas sp.]|uniref:hypothetical protein n=1 Tax=Pseudoalteromonas sp. TaxID=53249 RepID=UPI00260DDEEB|nr:hypothetical protein [Pseudoalteromonas sp.]MCP4585331.1 hypothetical protein [Pseudoalteromonas sp.]